MLGWGPGCRATAWPPAPSCRRNQVAALIYFSPGHLSPLTPGPGNARRTQVSGSTKDKFFDDFEVVDKEEVSGGSRSWS